MSLRSRLLLLVLLVALLPALLLGWRFFHDSEAEIKASVKALAASADTIADDLDQRVQGTAQLHFGLAHSRALDTTDRAACSDFLSEVREAYPQYTGILSVLPDGKLFCDSLRTGRDLNLADRAYFKRAQQGGGLTLEPAFGRLTGTPVLQIVYPVRSAGGTLRYLLVASLNLQKFAQESQKNAASQRPQLLLVDHRGGVLVWSGAPDHAPKPGTSMAGSAVFALAAAHAGGGVGEIVGDDGQAQVWAVGAASMARNAGVHVLLGLPRSALAADVQARLRQDLFTLAVAAVLLFAGVWLLAERGIRRPIGRITAMVRSLGSGDLAARIETPYPRGEMGGLMAVLNSTAASLQRQRAAIDELGLQLRQAQKLEAIGTLAGGIAHDFNNILGAILGNLSLALEEEQAGKSTRHSLDQVRRAALRARSLVQRIQAFSRVDAAALTRLSLRPLVEEVLALVQVALPPGVRLQAELGAADQRPLNVLADATQLHQVLMNLCTNAWQALQGEPGTVTVGLEVVTVKGGAPDRPAGEVGAAGAVGTVGEQRDGEGNGSWAPPEAGPENGLAPGDHAHLWVADTGCGIDAATCERIFEPYFTTKAPGTGTGLGLSVVHGIVTAHHGLVTVDSVPGRGSSFHVLLPLLAGAEGGAEPGGVDSEPPVDQPGRGQLIVCLDDDEVMGVLVARLLERAGYRVSSHLTAHAALDAVRADPAACSLVVTDFNMPELSGLDVARTLAALRPGLPVLIISGYIFDELPSQARAVGVSEVIRKQYVMEELVPAVGRALARVAP